MIEMVYVFEKPNNMFQNECLNTKIQIRQYP